MMMIDIYNATIPCMHWILDLNPFFHYSIDKNTTSTCPNNSDNYYEGKVTLKERLREFQGK